MENRNIDSLRVIEFFSGMGGYHFALEKSGIPFKVVKAYDMNSVANRCYSATFGSSPSNRSIAVLQAKELEKFKANCWVMSPPCQPFTRGGCMLDDADPRSQPLLHLLEVLSTLENPPEFLMVENVKNFETSNSRNKLIEALAALKYAVFEFLLSPWQFGMPNHRLRYYLVARRLPDLNLTPQPAVLQTRWPLERTGSLFENNLTFEPTLNSRCSLNINDANCQPLSDFLSALADKDPQNLVPSKYLLRSHNFRYDIVTAHHKLSSCFTKAYGSHHLFGSGSLVRPGASDSNFIYDFSTPSSLLELGLRFFTPWEVAALHGVPVAHKNHQCLANENLAQSATTIDFSDLSDIQKYRLLGNSLSVTVVAELVKLVF